MGYYASGDTRKTIHGCENEQGYDERDATFNGLIARVSGSDVRGGIALEARTPISDEADRPFWAEDESSSSESKQQLNERKKRRRTMSYRNNRIAVHKSRSSLFHSSSSSLDSVPDQISSRGKAQSTNGSVSCRTYATWIQSYKEKMHSQKSNLRRIRRTNTSLKSLGTSSRTMTLLVNASDECDRGKNAGYKRLEQVDDGYSILRPGFSLIITGIFVLFLLLSAWNLLGMINPTSNVHVFSLNRTDSPLHIVSERFLSLGLDTSLLREMSSLPINNQKFVNLARYLAPAYVRVGGTSADCLYFNQTVRVISEQIISPVNGNDISNFTITDVDFKSLYKFTTKSNLRMIFDLNALYRSERNSWDDANAKTIISFARDERMQLDWQLGNEPNSFHHVFNRAVNATQLASDYYQLRELLNKVGYTESLVVGPEVNHIGDKNQEGEYYATTFLQNDRDSVNYVTWHQYYLNGREARVADFINVSTFNYLPEQITSMQEAIKLSGKTVAMWLSETSTAYGGGAPELSDRFVAGFLWLDKLGYSASTGVNVVVRQTLFGEHYAMVAPDLTPNPDWWVSVIYKQFVSEKVLELTPTDKPDRVRLYAHCTPEKALIDRVSAITIYGVNIDKDPVRITINGISIALDAEIFLYVLTADDLQSRVMKLNGKLLILQPNGDLPPFSPVILESTEEISLPAYSMVFLVIHGVNVPACRC